MHTGMNGMMPSNIGDDDIFLFRFALTHRVSMQRMHALSDHLAIA